MAVDYVLRCDGCGTSIVESRVSLRDARARAQLNCGAVSSGGKDWCAACRQQRLAARQATAVGHTVGTQHDG